MLETNASTIARCIHGEPKESVPGRADWGKRFEDAYGKIAYESCKLNDFDINDYHIDDYDDRSMDSVYASWCEEMTEACGKEGQQIAELLLADKLVGYMPKAQHRTEGGYTIWAKPDLCLGYYTKPVEIKTYPLNDYARTIGKIMSWVWKEPLLLVGFKDGKLEKELLSGDDFDIKSVPKEAWEDRHPKNIELEVNEDG